MDTVDALRKLASWNLIPFRVGTVAHPLDEPLLTTPRQRWARVTCAHPARLEPMILDYSRLVDLERPMACTAGAVGLGVDLPTSAVVCGGTEAGPVIVSPRSARATVIQHAAQLVRAALGVREELSIEVHESHHFRHCGLGSSASIQVAVAAAINAMYDFPIAPSALVRYLAQNYGEEIDGDDQFLVPVQSIGDTGAVGLLGGGLVVVSGDATLIARMEIPASLRLVFGVPLSHKGLDGLHAFASDVSVFEMIREAGRRARYGVAYDVVHSLLPAIARQDLREIGNVFWSARCNDDNLLHYDRRYPGLKEAILRLGQLRHDGTAPIVSISSAGPIVFACTWKPEVVTALFEDCGFTAISAKSNNSGARIICESPVA